MAGRGGWGKPPGLSGLYKTLRLALASAGYKSEISVPQLKLNVRVTGLLSADHEQHGPGYACMPGAAPQNPPRPPGGIRHSGSICHAHASGSDPIYLPAQARARRVWQARPAARQGHPSTVIGPAAQRALARVAPWRCHAHRHSVSRATPPRPQPPVFAACQWATARPLAWQPRRRRMTGA